MSKESTPAIVVSDNGHAYLPEVAAVITHSDRYGAKPSAPRLKEAATMGNGKIYYWGSNKRRRSTSYMVKGCNPTG